MLWNGRAGLMAVLKESIEHTLLSISPLPSKGRDGRVGLMAMLKESI